MSQNHAIRRSHTQMRTLKRNEKEKKRKKGKKMSILNGNFFLAFVSLYGLRVE